MQTPLGPADGVLILGLGDLSRGDEGVGVRVAQEFAAAFSLPPNVRVGTTTAFDLDALDALEDVAFLLAIDSVYAEAAPETVFRIPLDEYARDAETPESLHEEAVLGAIGVMELLDRRPQGLLLAVPVAQGKARVGLSQALAEQLPALVGAVADELAQRGLTLERAKAG